MPSSTSGRFTVLASGSAGNAALLEAFSFSLLIDFGLPAAAIQQRLSHIGRSWSDVSAALLTHTHGDHWNLSTLEHLRSLRIPLYLHRDHYDFLRRHREIEPMRRADLLRLYDDGEWFELSTRLAALPILVPHDSEPTFGFRFECSSDDDSASWALGYASDFGAATTALTEAFRNLDVLALEFNHDEELQRNSGRHPVLIRRVLSNRGHLSNAQAALFVARLGSGVRRLSHLIQLHLSHECNTPALATAACAEFLRSFAGSLSIHTACQDSPTTPIALELRSPSFRYLPSPRFRQQILPGLEGEIG